MPATPRYFPLVALAEAWPFCAPQALEHGLVEIARSEDGRLDPATSALARGLDQHAGVLARGLSLTQSAAIRDRVWFGETADRRGLYDMLLDLAEHHLRWDGDAVRLKSCDADARHETTIRWRWLSLRLPQDLLIAALAARHRMEPCTDRVRLVGQALAPILERPVAETHLHMGAAFDFGEMWVALMLDATGPHFCARLPEAPAPFGDAIRYQRALVSAALIRQLLLAFLWRRNVRDPRDCPNFADFVAHRLPQIARRTGASARATTVELACRSALKVLRTQLGHDHGLSTSRMLRAHHLLLGPRPRIRSVDDLLGADPVARWLEPRAGLARPETRLMWHALRYASEAGKLDLAFQRTLWQYLRVRNLVFGHLVEAPGTSGLGWFARHYERLKAHRGLLERHVVGAALRLQSRDLNLRSLEVRTAPQPRWHELRDDLRACARQAANFEVAAGRERPELGVVLHFIKSEEKPGRYMLRCRYGRWFHDAWVQTEAIARVLRFDPRLLLILRGLDVAANEIAIPTWVLVPLFRRARQASREAAARLARERPLWRVAPLRATLHVGEDFHRLSGGLRRIHEAVELGLVGEGDRIGHGLALGWSVQQWIEHNPVSTQPREERIFDLLWELERYRRAELPVEHDRVPYIEEQLYLLGNKLFSRSVTVSELLDFRRGLFHGSSLNVLDFPFGRVDPGTWKHPVHGLVARYLLDPSVRRRARAPIEVRSSEREGEVLELAQGWLRGQLALLGVTVETNPSSNLVIGDFTDLCEHPTFRLAPLEQRNSGDDNSLLVSINSDDPLTFATCLADEYAYMEAAIIGQRVGVRDALWWLDQAREAGWNSRFTLPPSSSRDNLRRLRGRVL